MKCVNCAKPFNGESHAPRMLGCGHTFCHFCISTLLDCGELACPTCGHKQSVNHFKDVPLNRALLEIIFEQERDKTIPQECLCVFHQKVLKSFCNKCRECTCQDCYKELHNKEFGCDEVCFSDDESNLENSAIVKKVNGKIETLSEELNGAKEELQLAKKFETFKECYWGLSQYRNYLEVNCVQLNENLSAFQNSKGSLLQCSSSSEFMDCCKGLFSSRNHPQTARDVQLQPLGVSSLRKNFVPVQLAFLKKLYAGSEAAAIPGPDSSCCSVIVQRRATSGHVIVNHAFSLDDSDIMNLFKEFNSNNLDKIRLSWPLGAIEGEESNNLRGRSVYADIQIHKEQVETFYKIFTLGEPEDMLIANNGINMIQLKKAKSVFCFWQKESHEAFTCDDEFNPSRQNLVLGLDTDDKTEESLDWDVPTNEWPVFALITESAPDLVLMKFPINNTSKSFKLVGTWKIGGDVQDMPGTWQSTTWRLSANS